MIRLSFWHDLCIKKAHRIRKKSQSFSENLQIVEDLMDVTHSMEPLLYIFT